MWLDGVLPATELGIQADGVDRTLERETPLTPSQFIFQGLELEFGVEGLLLDLLGWS